MANFRRTKQQLQRKQTQVEREQVFEADASRTSIGAQPPHSFFRAVEDLCMGVLLDSGQLKRWLRVLKDSPMLVSRTSELSEAGQFLVQEARKACTIRAQFADEKNSDEIFQQFAYRVKPALSNPAKSGKKGSKVVLQAISTSTERLVQSVYKMPTAIHEIAGLDSTMHDLCYHFVPQLQRQLHDISLLHIEVIFNSAQLTLDNVYLPAQSLILLALDIKARSQIHLNPRERIRARAFSQSQRKAASTHGWENAFASKPNASTLAFETFDIPSSTARTACSSVPTMTG